MSYSRRGCLMRSLKPGGRFAVIDFPPDKPGTGTIAPALRATGDTHGVTTATVLEELKAAGFEIVDVLPKWHGGLFFVLARRPLQPGHSSAGRRSVPARRSWVSAGRC